MAAMKGDTSWMFPSPAPVPVVARRSVPIAVRVVWNEPPESKATTVPVVQGKTTNSSITVFVVPASAFMNVPVFTTVVPEALVPPRGWGPVGSVPTFTPRPCVTMPSVTLPPPVRGAEPPNCAGPGTMLANWVFPSGPNLNWVPGPPPAESMPLAAGQFA
jgi:hypothetical protein